MFFEPRDYLHHMLAEAEYLLGKSRDMTLDEFIGDETLQRALVRSLEVIGEAAKKVPASFRAEHPAIEWRAMAGMRDRLIHDSPNAGGDGRLPGGMPGMRLHVEAAPVGE